MKWKSWKWNDENIWSKMIQEQERDGNSCRTGYRDCISRMGSCKRWLYGIVYFSNWKNWAIVNYVAPLMRSVDWNKEAFTKAVITARRSPQGERGLKSSVNSSVFHLRFRQPVTIAPSIVLFIVLFPVFTIWSLWAASMAVLSFQYAGFMPDFSSTSKNSPQIQKNFSKPSDRDYPPFRFRY